METARRELRARLGSAVEMSYPHVDLKAGTNDHVAVVSPDAAIHRSWSGSSATLIALVAERTDVPIDEMRSRSRIRRVVEARRLAVALGRSLGVPLVKVARGLGISGPAAVQMLGRAGPPMISEAESIARLVLDEQGEPAGARKLIS